MLMVLYRSSQEGVIFKKRQNHHYVRSLPTCLTFTFITSLSHPMDVCRKSGHLFKDIYLFLAEIFIQCFLFLGFCCFSQSSMIKGRFCNYTLYICICSLPCLFDALCSKYIFLFAIFSLIKLGLFWPILILY